MNDQSSEHTHKTMLITGASGFIGSRLATLALSRGYAVRTLTRSDWNGSPPVRAEQRYFGSLPEQIPAHALQDVRVVVHCAAVTEGDDGRGAAVNVDGTGRLALLALEAGVHTIILLSS